MKNTGETNPFTEDLVIVPGRRMIDYNEYNKNKKKYDDEGVMPYMFFESADKMSVYTNPSIRITLCNMSGSALKILVWLQQSIDYGTDIIKFNTNKFLKETGMSTSTFQKAKEELITNNIIALKESDKKYWWINPIIMFKGNRTKKYPDNIAVFKSTNNNLTSDTKI
jgi:hypothetical protein